MTLQYKLSYPNDTNAIHWHKAIFLAFIGNRLIKLKVFFKK